MAIDPIVLRFATAGLPEVQSAFATLTTSARKLEDKMSADATRGSRARVTTAEREAREKERAAAKVAREAAKAEEARTKAEAREVKNREKAQQTSLRQVAREQDRARREELRETERSEERKLRIRIRSSEQAGRFAAKQAKEEIAAREKEFSKHRATMGRVGSSVGGAIGGAARMAGAGLALAGGFEMADAFRRRASDERAAALLVNSATSGGVVQPGASVSNIMGITGQVSRETGVGRTDIIEGIQNYVALSGAQNFGAAMSNAGFFAKMSQATGSSLKDITGAAGILQAQNPNLSQSDMRQMLLDIMEQGKSGAVEIKDLASLAGGLGSTRGLYQGSVTENQRKLLALAQITRTEGASAEEAMVAVKDLGTEATAKARSKDAPAWLKAAVDPRTGQIKGGPEALIEAALTGTGGNLGALTNVFGQRGSKAFDRLAPIFNAAGGGQKGLAAVRAEMTAGGFNARGSMASLDQQYSQVMDTSGKRFETALNSISQKMEDAMGPALESLAKKLSDPKVEAGLASLIGAVGQVVGFLAENPFKGIGLIVAGKVTADIAQAAIGSAVKGILEQVIRGAMGAGGGAIPTVGAGGRVAAALGTGVVAAALTAAAVDSDVTGKAAQQSSDAMAGVGSQSLVFGVRRKIKAGTATAADLAALQSAAAGAEARQKRLAAGPETSLLETASFGIGALTGRRKEVQEAVAAKQAENARATKMATDELNLLKKQIQETAAALKGMQQTIPRGIPPVTTNAPASPIGSSGRAG